MLNRSHFRRPRRAGEWTEGKAVTFIVTLAAHRSVTLAAARAGMSRKSAYALKGRDSGFAAAWDAACVAGRPQPRQGDKGDEGYNPGVGGLVGYTGSAPDMRDLSFEEMLTLLRDSGPRPLARMAPRP